MTPLFSYPLTGKKSYRYSGAKLTGNLSFKVVGAAVYKKSFKEVKKPPHNIISYHRPAPSTPSDALFREVFYSSSFCENFAEMIGELYGPKALISVRKDSNSNVRKEAAEALGKI